MWVWDTEERKKQLKVIHISKGDIPYPVITIDNDGSDFVDLYRHCAEIEKQRRMTNKELSRWLREKPTREYKYKEVTDYIYSFYEYKECYSDEEVNDIILIREDDGEWREPLVEEE